MGLSKLSMILHNGKFKCNISILIARNTYFEMFPISSNFFFKADDPKSVLILTLGAKKK